MSTEQPPRATGGFGDIISRVLSFIDKPWKAVVVVVLIIILGGGYIVWDLRDRLINLLVQPRIAEVTLRDDVKPQMAALLKGTGADLVTVWTFDIGANRISYVGGETKDEKYWTPEALDLPDNLPAMVSGGNAAAQIAVLRGLTTCEDVSTGHNVFLRRMLAAGYVRGCVVAVHAPRSTPIALVGMFWKKPPDVDTEKSVLQLAEDISYTMLDLPGSYEPVHRSRRDIR